MICSYLGSKSSLLPYIDHIVYPLISESNSKIKFIDLFLGSGCVSNHYKNHVSEILCCDQELYSYVFGKALLQCPYSDKLKGIIKDLNLLQPKKGLVYKYFASNDKLFFSSKNAQMIDAMRQEISVLVNNHIITYPEYIFLLGSLLISSSAIGNTCGTWRAYLKVLSKKALKPFILFPIHEDTCITCKSQVKLLNVCDLNIETTTTDIIYIDPPYNSAHYGAYYSFFNYLCAYDCNIKLQGTGIIQDYNKSKYGLIKSCNQEFRTLFEKIKGKSKHIIMSYSSNAIMNIKDLISMLADQYGCMMHVYKIKHKQYTPNASKCRNNTFVIEYLVHIDCTKPKSSITYKWLHRL
jgi:adenine-specific DNA-methyltransferase